VVLVTKTYPGGKEHPNASAFGLIRFIVMKYCL